MNIIGIHILTQILLALLTFIALHSLRKIFICRMCFPLWCVLCKLSIYTLSYQWITLWWAIFELEYQPLLFIYSNSKFKVTCKNTKTLIQKRNFLKFVTLHLPVCFSHKNIIIKLPPWVLVPLWIKPSDILQDGSF